MKTISLGGVFVEPVSQLQSECPVLAGDVRQQLIEPCRCVSEFLDFLFCRPVALGSLVRRGLRQQLIKTPHGAVKSLKFFLRGALALGFLIGLEEVRYTIPDRAVSILVVIVTHEATANIDDKSERGSRQLSEVLNQERIEIVVFRPFDPFRSGTPRPSHGHLRRFPSGGPGANDQVSEKIANAAGRIPLSKRTAHQAAARPGSAFGKTSQNFHSLRSVRS